ncbi:MAG: hypothetical protein ACPKPY_03275 [Nitrososphaeraceae archaeon]
MTIATTETKSNNLSKKIKNKPKIFNGFKKEQNDGTIPAPWREAREVPMSLEEYYDYGHSNDHSVVVMRFVLSNTQIEVMKEICRVEGYNRPLQGYVQNAIKQQLDIDVNSVEETGRNFCKFLKDKLEDPHRCHECGNVSKGW